MRRIIPSFSIIIPVYNEELCLLKQLRFLFHELGIHNITNFEVILVENGSTDNTYKLLQSVSYPNTSIIRLKTSSYGCAIREGIRKARKEFIVQFDIDLIDVSFIRQAISLLSSYDVVVGSKLLSASADNRPLGRVMVTRMLSFLIRILHHYPGTDTHGIKIYRRKNLMKLISQVQTNHHFFDTELLVRAHRSNILITELPVSITELRPSRFPAALRIRQALSEFFVLWKALS